MSEGRGLYFGRGKLGICPLILRAPEGAWPESNASKSEG